MLGFGPTGKMGENGQSFVLGSKARTGSDRRFRANHSGSLSTGSPVGSLERKSQQHFLPKLIIKGNRSLSMRTLFAIAQH